jgi:TolA-binding protein
LIYEGPTVKRFFRTDQSLRFSGKKRPRTNDLEQRRLNLHQTLDFKPDFKLAFCAFDRNIARPIMEQKAAELTLGEKLFVWFEANKKQATWGAGIVIVVGFMVFYYIWAQGEKEVKAGKALSQVLAGNLFAGAGRTASPDAYLRVADGHPGTPAAAQALLLAGGALFVEAKYAEAQSQFQRFSREFPGNPFVSQALLGIAACLDAQGKVDEAARAYQDASSRYPGAHTVSQAKLGLARCYEAQGKLDQARTVYEELAAAESFSSVGNEAAFRLEALKAKPPVVSPEAPTTTNPPAFKLSTPQ